MSMWSFSSSGGWHCIDDLFENCKEDGLDEMLNFAGFSSTTAISVGDGDSGSFYVHVYRSYGSYGETKYEFLSCIEIGGTVDFVVIPSLPDLLDFLRQTIPLSISINDWRIQH